jgi:O-antigen ligase
MSQKVSNESFHSSSARKRSASELAKQTSVAHVADADPGAAVVGYAVIAALVAAAFLVDPWADASFDAPKWLVVRVAALTAALALVLRAKDFSLTWTGEVTRMSLSAGLLVIAIVLAIAATIRSVHVVSWDYLLLMGVGVSWIVVGGSKVLDDERENRVFRVFMVCASITALMSLLQIAGIRLPLEVATLGGRYDSGALLGNEGYVALTCALLGACAIALLVASEVTNRTRRVAWAALILAIATIALNRQATSALALVAATFVILSARFGKRWLIYLIALGLTGVTVLGSISTHPSLQLAKLSGVHADTLQRLTTYRLGAWVAAHEMILTHPLLGRGPGSFAQESTNRRLHAEIKLQTRFVQPVGATFVSAHHEPLQLAAEIGIPATLAIIGAFGMVMFGLIAAPGSVVDSGRLVLLGLLSCGGVAAFAWFPLQIPLTSVVLLVATGRAWRRGYAEKNETHV